MRATANSCAVDWSIVIYALATSVLYAYAHIVLSWVKKMKATLTLGIYTSHVFIKGKIQEDVGNLRKRALPSNLGQKKY